MYKYIDLPKDADSYFIVENRVAYTNPSMHNLQQTHNKEHTMQIDYMQRWKEIHTLNVGGKYIIRNNTNDSRYYTLHTPREWFYHYSPEDMFHHQQKVFSLYVEYELNKNNISYTFGLRNEFTKERILYADAGLSDFDIDFNNFLPFGGLSYTLNNRSHVGVSYRSRISRPGIYYLNPKKSYVDFSTVYYGNPELDSEKHQTLELEYSTMYPKGMLNLSLNYTFCNNAIQGVYGMNGDGLLYNTYNNGGRNKEVSLSGFLSYAPVSFMRLSVSATGKHVYVSNVWNNKKISNEGFTGSLSGNISFNLPKSYRLNLYGSYNFPRIDLQGKYFNFYYCGWRLSKSFLKDKLDVSVRGSDVFWKFKKFNSTYTTDLVQIKSETKIQGMTYELSISYKFNSSRSSIKKTEKTIRNTDVRN